MWESIAAKIGYDILKKFLTDLFQLASDLYSKYITKKTNAENANKLSDDLNNGASDEQVAKDGENLLNSTKH